MMEPTTAALWLDSTFEGFDTAVLGAVHAVQQSAADTVLGPLARGLDVFGAAGAGLIAMGVVLTCISRTRHYGVAVLLALAIGALFTNVALKPLVARERPYVDQTRVIHQWWQEAGREQESDHSFPSGHTTAAMAAMAALFLLNKRKLWPCLMVAALMGLSRLYLVVHYPTDVIAGWLVGFLAALLAVWILHQVPWFHPQLSQ